MKKKYIIPQTETETNTTFNIELLMMRDSGQYSNIMESKERNAEFDSFEKDDEGVTYGNIW